MWAEPRFLSKVVQRTATVNEDGSFQMQLMADKPLTMKIGWAAIPIHGDKTLANFEQCE
jgi:hypothetical protein